MNSNIFTNPKEIKYIIKKIDDNYYGLNDFYAS